ncbi:hypothetical protein ES332_D12G153700v1 [Gossypium tomentosum]|uniref:Uncharacterized protein n=1 Tax=Gossypium tomentosum TaxID=34277 RepID=A0A5D2I8Z1_GOSTO|nr:hypothetical protein ES332_D12G153700v1 [Gossypium tomentosum]
MHNRMGTRSGVKGSIPAWIKFSVQAAGEIPYSGIYYDPPEEEKYVFKHPHTKRPKSLRIYESHAGMSSIVCISLFPCMNCYSSRLSDCLPVLIYCYLLSCHIFCTVSSNILYDMFLQDFENEKKSRSFLY